MSDSIGIEKKDSSLDKVKSVCLLILVSVFSVKFYETPISLIVDFPTLLSLLLGFFSVALAALFYFKATETSNAFYDNTHKFTRDIAQLLVKIESGFGEKLKHLDEGYVAMRNQLQSIPYPRDSEGVKEAKADIKAEKEEIENVLKERNSLIDELVKSSQLEAAKKDSIVEELKRKEHELDNARKELSRMDKRLLINRMEGRSNRSGSMPDHVEDFTGYVIKDMLSENTARSPARNIIRDFNDNVHRMPDKYLEDLAQLGYYRSGLTPEGAVFIRRVARSFGEKSD